MTNEGRVPVSGDDIKFQAGSNTVHSALDRLDRQRGGGPDQLDLGGDADFPDMLGQERLISKKVCRTVSASSQLDYASGKDNVQIGTFDYVPWLHDPKFAAVRLQGRGFGEAPLKVELEVRDSPPPASISTPSAAAGWRSMGAAAAPWRAPAA